MRSPTRLSDGGVLGCALGGPRVAQLSPEPAYDHRLAERVVVYLQTRDPALFPFTARFDAARRRAFVNDLREALADLTDSGSARKTSAAGFIMKDRRLHDVVREWAAANGGWPHGADPRVAVTSLGAVSADDEAPDSVIKERPTRGWRR
jgi:hypothetical protein